MEGVRGSTVAVKIPLSGCLATPPTLLWISGCSCGCRCGCACGFAIVFTVYDCIVMICRWKLAMQCYAMSECCNAVTLWCSDALMLWWFVVICGDCAMLKVEIALQMAQMAPQFWDRLMPPFAVPIWSSTLRCQELLQYHPAAKEKIGPGLEGIKVPHTVNLTRMTLLACLCGLGFTVCYCIFFVEWWYSNCIHA